MVKEKELRVGWSAVREARSEEYRVEWHRIMYPAYDGRTFNRIYNRVRKKGDRRKNNRRCLWQVPSIGQCRSGELFRSPRMKTDCHLSARGIPAGGLFKDHPICRDKIKDGKQYNRYVFCFLQYFPSKVNILINMIMSRVQPWNSAATGNGTRHALEVAPSLSPFENRWASYVNLTLGKVRDTFRIHI
jgi:hypothetical protein